MTDIAIATGQGSAAKPVRSERERWIALVVLCVGMLMIILDGTIVNVALPSIQGDLGFSQSSLAWVVNAYLIAFGGLLLLAGRLGDLLGRRRVFLVGLAVFTAASLLCGAGREPGAADRRALRPGRRRRADLRGDPRHDRHDVPGAAGAGEGDRRLQLRRLRPAARSACWPAACSPRRSTGTGSSSSTCRSASSTARPRAAAARRATRASASARAPTCPARCWSPAALMLGVYTIVEARDYGWGSAHTLGLGAVVARAAGRLRRPRGDAPPTR